MSLCVFISNINTEYWPEHSLKEEINSWFRNQFIVDAADFVLKIILLHLILCYFCNLRVQQWTQSSPLIVGTHPFCRGGWASNQIFKKRGGVDRTSTFRGGCWERWGWRFSGRGGVQFSHKIKLKSEIFNDKKSL